MKLAAMFGSSSSAVGATAVGAVALVAGAIGFTLFNAPDDAPLDQPTPTMVADGMTSEPTAVRPEAPASEPGSGIEPPRLDLVRVDAGGGTVIAGQTSPNLTVVILLDGAQIAVTRSDGVGDFVSLLTLPPSVSPRTLSVEAWPEDAPVLAGLETVFIAPVTAGGLDPMATAAIPDVDVTGSAPLVTSEPDVSQDPAADGAPGDIASADVIPVEAAPEETHAAMQAADAAASPSDAPIDAAASIPVVVAEPSATAPVPEPTASLTPDPGDEEPEEVASVQSADASPAPAPTPTPNAPGAFASGPATLTAPALSTTPTVATTATGPAAPLPARSAAPSVVISGPDGVRVVQGPTSEPEVQTSVRLDAISYDADGQVILAGRGPVSTDIQVYLNNQPIQLGEIGPGGAWSLQLPDVDPGTYTLAVAELAEDGSTASRVETPFLREDPDRVAEAPVAQAAGIDVITVQPGFTLWGIAQNTFGDGILYVQIFEENQDQIRDPNWIFPGQIFRMPDVAQPNSEN